MTALPVIPFRVTVYHRINGVVSPRTHSARTLDDAVALRDKSRTHPRCIRVEITQIIDEWRPE